MEWLLKIPFLLTVLIIATHGRTRPNIIYFLMDDLGYNDVGYHDCSIKSPVITQLASEGIILENNYVAPACSPSRAALLTGRYSFHVGYQSGVPHANAPVCLTMENPILPEAMKALGYSTYMLGKWHMGYCKEECLPTNRGFDRFYGYYSGGLDFYTHKSGDLHDLHNDFHNDYQHDTCSYGAYCENLFGTRANEYIDMHITQNTTKDNPFFIYFSPHTVHSPLQVPEEYLQMHLDEPDADRRVIKAMVSVADDILGNLVNKLKEKNLYDNTIIVFSSDNGGVGGVAGYSKNFPLRGGKATVWEGGVRVPGFVHSPLLKESAGTVSKELFHIADWYPTIISLAGGTIPDYVDGYDQTDLIIHGGVSKRTIVPIQYDQYDPPIYGRAAIRVGKWKLMRGFPGRLDGYDSILTGPDALRDTYDNSPGIQSDYFNPSLIMNALNAENDIYLFDLEADPTERINLAENRPDKVQELMDILQGFADTAVDRDPNFNVPSTLAGPESYRGLISTGWC